MPTHAHERGADEFAKQRRRTLGTRLELGVELRGDVERVLGQLDDIGVLIFGLDFFIRNAPKAVVEEHMSRIARNDDELKHDLERAQEMLSGRASELRATLDRILSRDRGGDNS